MAVEKGLGDKCFEDLKMLPRGFRYIAVASSQNRSICYWTSMQIQSQIIEPSGEGIFSAARSMAAGMGRFS